MRIRLSSGCACAPFHGVAAAEGKADVQIRDRVIIGDGDALPMEAEMSDRARTASEKAEPMPNLASPSLSPQAKRALSLLEAERHRLLDKIRQQESQIAQDDPPFESDAVDCALRLSGRSNLVAMRRLSEATLREVEHAIARIKAGCYGICERCGRPIAEERLLALPSTVLCIDCSRSHAQYVRA